jgi:hypothetical protein
LRQTSLGPIGTVGTTLMGASLVAAQVATRTERVEATVKCPSRRPAQQPEPLDPSWLQTELSQDFAASGDTTCRLTLATSPVPGRCRSSVLLPCTWAHGMYRRITIAS